MSEPIEYELSRDRSDRRRYIFSGLGSVRLEGFLKRGATAEVGSERVSIRRSAWSRRIEAAAPSGETIGEFRGRLLSSGGTIQWNGRELLLRRDSMWRERYVLEYEGRTLARFQVGAWGGFPASIRVESPGEVESALLLFTAFVVRTAAADNSSASVVASTGATTGG